MFLKNILYFQMGIQCGIVLQQGNYFHMFVMLFLAFDKDMYNVKSWDF